MPELQAVVLIDNDSLAANDMHRFHVHKERKIGERTNFEMKTPHHFTTLPPAHPPFSSSIYPDTNHYNSDAAETSLKRKMDTSSTYAHTGRHEGRAYNS
jgi:hypothetical protein